MNPFEFDIRSLPAGGKQISGTLPPGFFGLEEKDLLKAESPLTYELTIDRDDKDILVTGSLDATFNLECGRCLGRFQHRVELPFYQTEIPIEKETTMDLTDLVREDMLLALPTFPRCEDGNVEPRDCPAEGRFDPTDDPLEDKEPGGDKVWNVLDQLK